jgi:hypothetical protein
VKRFKVTERTNELYPLDFDSHLLSSEPVPSLLRHTALLPHTPNHNRPPTQAFLRVPQDGTLPLDLQWHSQTPMPTIDQGEGKGFHYADTSCDVHSLRPSSKEGAMPNSRATRTLAAASLRARSRRSRRRLSSRPSRPCGSVSFNQWHFHPYAPTIFPQ